MSATQERDLVAFLSGRDIIVKRGNIDKNGIPTPLLDPIRNQEQLSYTKYTFPRDIAIDPHGKYLGVALKNTNPPDFLVNIYEIKQE